MKEALKTAMTNSISDVLETMFFMTLTIDEQADPKAFLASDGDALVASHIVFHGPFSGHFIFMVPKEILESMSKTFAGLDSQKVSKVSEVSDAHILGTISEAINMIAGNTFSNLNDQAIFKLGIPEITQVPEVNSRSNESRQDNLFLLIKTSGGNMGLQVFYSPN